MKTTLRHHHEVITKGTIRCRTVCPTDRWYRQGPSAWMRGRWKVANTYQGWLVFRAGELHPAFAAYRTGMIAMFAVGEQEDWLCDTTSST